MSDSPSTAERTDKCQACKRLMPHRGTCPTCGWQRGKVTTPTWLPDGSYVYNKAEETSGKRLLGGLCSTAGGLLLLLFGAFTAGGGLIFFGLLCLAAGVTSLTVTRMGRLWDGLQAEERAAAWPGILVGWLPAAAVVAFIGLMAQL
ncbi:hypothetical protein GCM10010510_07970 [Streptomyces anandii JCM 4720]|nr:hypothetical protein GCM10010510_07970 [Streptomyces anandii JCM 4720]